MPGEASGKMSSQWMGPLPPSGGRSTRSADTRKLSLVPWGSGKNPAQSMSINKRSSVVALIGLPSTDVGEQQDFTDSRVGLSGKHLQQNDTDYSLTMCCASSGTVCSSASFLRSPRQTWYALDSMVCSIDMNRS